MMREHIGGQVIEPVQEAGKLLWSLSFGKAGKSAHVGEEHTYICLQPTDRSMLETASAKPWVLSRTSTPDNGTQFASNSAERRVAELAARVTWCHSQQAVAPPHEPRNLLRFGEMPMPKVLVVPPPG